MVATVNAATAQLPLTLRTMRDGDLPFIVSTWALSAGDPGYMSRDKWRTNMRRSAQLTLKRSARVVVLASAEHDSTILGWACGDDGVVHAAYFRPELRASAVGRAWVADVLAAAAALPESSEVTR